MSEAQGQLFKALSDLDHWFFEDTFSQDWFKEKLIAEINSGDEILPNLVTKIGKLPLYLDKNPHKIVSILLSLESSNLFDVRSCVLKTIDKVRLEEVIKDCTEKHKIFSKDPIERSPKEFQFAEDFRDAMAYLQVSALGSTPKAMVSPRDVSAVLETSYSRDGL